jgi:hypothetical protein
VVCIVLVCLGVCYYTSCMKIVMKSIYITYLIFSTKVFVHNTSIYSLQIILFSNRIVHCVFYLVGSPRTHPLATSIHGPTTICRLACNQIKILSHTHNILRLHLTFIIKHSRRLAHGLMTVYRDNNIIQLS